MEPKIVQLEAFTVVGLKFHGKPEKDEIPQLWGALMPRAQEIKNVVDGDICYGVCTNMDYETGEFDYFAAFKVGSTEGLPEGMEAYTVPDGTYAVFSTALPKVGETYDYAYKTWLPQSTYKPTGGADFELYDETFDPHNPESTFEICIPIK